MWRWDHNSHKVLGSDEERFWKRVKLGSVNACWEWQGYVMPSGYGRFNVKGKSPVYAHRFSFELANKISSAGKVVMHLCNNKKCVNPGHLRMGTQKENLEMAERDGLAKKPWSKWNTCKNGHLYQDFRDVRGYRLCSICRPRVKRF